MIEDNDKFVLLICLQIESQNVQNSFQAGDVAFLSRPGSAYGLRPPISHSRDARMVNKRNLTINLAI